MTTSIPLGDLPGFARLVDPDAGRQFSLGNFDAQRALDDGRLGDIIRAIYDALAKLDLRYAHEADSDRDTQSVRTTTEILRGEQRGTCVDLAILFAGACLTYKLLPLLVLQDHHAIVAVSSRFKKDHWNADARSDDEPFRRGAPALKELEPLWELIQRGAYQAVDCTGFVIADNRYRFAAPETPSAGGKLPFEAACAAARAELEHNQPPFIVALDIETLHATGYEYRPEPGAAGQSCPPPGQIRASWTAWEAALRGVLFERELDRRPALLPSPLLKPWHAFRTSRPWPLRVRACIDKLRAASQGAKLSLVDEVVAALGRIDWTQPYAAIAEQGRRQRFDALIGQLNARLNDLAAARTRTKATQPTPEEHQVLVDARRATYACSDLFERPDYRVCFPVLGSSGCGTTHFIATLLADSPTAERDLLVLPLRVDGPQRDVGEWICRAAGEAGGVPFDDVASLDRFLDEADLRLVLILDDLHEMRRWWPGITAALRAFIEMHSHRVRIRWIATLLDTRYDEVLDCEDFWASYGVTDDSNLSGWLIADLWNEREHLGHHLFDERGQGRVRLDEDIDPATGRLLDSPFMAWLMLDTAARRDAPLTIANLHFVELMTAFWAERQRREPALRTSHGVEEVRARLAFRLAETGADRVRSDQLVREVIEQQKGALDGPAVHALLGLFVDVNLLSRTKIEGDDFERPPADGVAYRFEGFWCWTVAQGLERSADGKPVEPSVILQRFRAKLANNHRDAITEAVWEFLLLLDDQRARARPRRGVGTLLEAYLTDPSFRDADARLGPALWFATAKASADVQRTVVERAGKLLCGDLAPRQAFSVLYFVLNAIGPDRPALFRLIQPLFHAIAVSQLQRYLLHAVRQHLESEDDAVQVARALANLVGAEVMGVEEELAEFALDALAARCDPLETMIPLVIEHVATARIPPGTPRPQHGTSTWRQWLFHAMCDRLLHHHGIRTFELLMDAGWYAGRSGRISLSRAVTKEMRSAANLAFGHWYRTRNHRRERVAYEELVERLVQSKLTSDRELAFYLIRHSVATHKQRAVTVAPQFRDALERLWRDPALAALRRQWGPFFDVNLRS